MVDTAVDAFGGVDILVNNAAALAGADRVPVVDLPEEVWDRVLTVNVKGTYLCSKAVVRTMIERGEGGRIVNMSSVSGLRGVPRFAAYCASKFAINGFTQALAKEVGRHRITVNSICPTTVDNERTSEIAAMVKPDDFTTEEYRTVMYDRTIQSTPLGRVALPADVARVAAFLASDESDFLTGISIIVSGGQVT
jgi:NAD(P)-dependent dehydrogenase (short-subunit alcohol dehydrogenase family)